MIDCCRLTKNRILRSRIPQKPKMKSQIETLFQAFGYEKVICEHCGTRRKKK